MAKAPSAWARRRRLFVNIWDRLKIALPAALVVAAGFWLAYQFVEPAPPSRIVMASGPESGAYHAFAQRYAERLARDKIELEIRPTAGSAANLDLLADEASGVDVAFVQGGIGSPVELPDLVSLGSVYFEPLWVFVRRPVPPGKLSDLRGERIAVGVPGSGTRPVALRLLADNGIDANNSTLVELGADAAADALRAGRLEAAIFITASSSRIVASLLDTSGVQLASFGRSEAYSRRYRFLSPVLLPEGVLDLARNLPGRDIRLLAPAAVVVAGPNLHPALRSLLLEAMHVAHRAGGLLEMPEQFPSARYLTFPLSEDARRFLESGPSFLQRYLPFWAANLVDRLKIMILPLLTLLIPLFKIVPPAYRWRIAAKINRKYKALQTLDDRINAREVKAPEGIATLDRIEEEVERLSIPAGYADRVYHLRLHIELLRRRLGRPEFAQTD